MPIDPLANSHWTPSMARNTADGMDKTLSK
jgi:hypothetical protein